MCCKQTTRTCNMKWTLQATHAQQCEIVFLTPAPSVLIVASILHTRSQVRSKCICSKQSPTSSHQLRLLEADGECPSPSLFFSLGSTNAAFGAVDALSKSTEIVMRSAKQSSNFPFPNFTGRILSCLEAGPYFFQTYWGFSKC